MLFRSDRKSTRLNSSHTIISYAVFCLKKKKEKACETPSRDAARGAAVGTLTPQRRAPAPLLTVCARHPPRGARHGGGRPVADVCVVEQVLAEGDRGGRARC